MDSLTYLQEQLIRLQRKYPLRPRYCALRMAITSIHALFMQYAKNIRAVSVAQAAGQSPSIVFLVKGGLGDLVIACNYIYCFYQYLSDAPFSIKICYYYPHLLKEFGEGLPGVVETSTQFDELEGSLKIELNRFPRVLAGNEQQLSDYSPRLGRLLSSWRQFMAHNRKFFDFMPCIDGMSNEYAVLLGSKRINQADTGGVLGMNEEYIAPLSMPADAQGILRRFGLAERSYITLQRGHSTVDEVGTRNTKLWPIECYSHLAGLLKQHYPKYTLVQLGTKRKGFDIDFEHIDVNLRGKTSLQELKVILKHARLHIDTEGGLVHLRHALKGGPSVVLFGPTSPDIYGYLENLNLRTTACAQPCEWITNDWLTRCARREDKNCCMRSLTPQWVLDRIREKYIL